MEDFSAILKKLRKKIGITQDELAHRLDIRKTTVSNYETGYSSPSKETLLKMATTFNVTMDELLGRNQAESMHETSASATHACSSDSISSLGNVHNGKTLFAHPINHLIQEEYFRLTIDSDSMNLSRLEMGDTIIVHKQASAENGDIVILLIDDEKTTIGHYYKNGNQITLMPNSTNKKNEPAFYNLDEHRVEILGKVVKAIISTI